MSESSSKIVRLQIENVMRINSVLIEPVGNAIFIGGKNAQGKSAVLDCIEMLFGGKKAVPADPIRHGAKKARIIGETEDLIITRTFTAKDTYIKVEAKDGSPLKGQPQEMLNSLWSNLSFDPLRFMEMKPLEQLEELKRLLGLDFTELDAEYAEIYGERTAVNAEWKRVKTEADALEVDPDAPDKEVDVAQVMEKLEAAQGHNAEIAKWQQQRQAQVDALADAEDAVKEARRKVEEAEAHVLSVQGSIDGCDSALNEMVTADTEPLSAQIREADSVNTAVRAKKAYAAKVAQARKVKARADAMTADLDGIAEAKAEMIQNAPCPIPDISFNSETVLYKGVPLAQASDAEKVGISADMGLALNPKLKILLYRRASLLDDDMRKIIVDKAEAADGQFFLEVVGHDPDSQIIIEDGSVLEAAEEGGE